MSDEVPYQQAGLVAQLRAERANAVAYGQADRVAAADKQLAELGVRAEAAEKRKADAEADKADTRSGAPRQRQSRPQQQG